MNQSRREFRATWLNDEAWLELGLGVVRGWGYGLGSEPRTELGFGPKARVRARARATAH